MKHVRTFVVAYALLAVSVVLWWVFLQLRPEHEGVANFLFNAVYGLPLLVGGTVGLLRSRAMGGTKSAVGFSLAMVSLGAMSFGTALMIWTYYNLFRDTEVPSPGLPDLFYLSYYAFMIPGMARFLRDIRDDKTRTRLIFTLPFVMVAAGAILALLWPTIARSGQGLALVNTAFVAFDSILFTVALASLFAVRGALGRSFMVLSAGIFFNAVGNLTYSWRLANGLYWNGDLSDGLFALSAVTIAAALIFFAPRRPGIVGSEAPIEAGNAGAGPSATGAVADRAGSGMVKGLIYVAYFLVFVVYLVWWTRLQFIPDHEDLPNYLFNVLYGLPPALVALGVMAVRRSKLWKGGALGRVTLDVALSMLMIGVAQLVWTFYNIVLEVDLPSPSFADAFYLLYYVFIVTALIRLVVLSRDPRAQKYLMYSLLVSMVLTGVTLAFVLPVSLHGDIGLLAMNSTYIIADMLVLVLAGVNFLIGGGKVMEAVVFLLVGAVLTSVGDVVYSYRTGLDMYWNGDVSDGFLALGILLSLVGLTQLVISSPVAPAPTSAPGGPVRR